MSDVCTCSACGTVMDVSSLGFYAELTCPICGETCRVHTELANFRIEGVLGVGGMSVVFSARDLVLGRELAIKVLNDIYRDTPERISRFESECAMMARVRHENVVSVYSAGWARGQFYIAMEKVEGRNLELLLAEHKCLMPDEALDVVRQVASGLQAAAEAGVLHRDMKPGNIIITPEGLAKVLDFGLSLEDRPDAQREETIWATPFFVPPETLLGNPEDARTDIYALGMTLRSMVTGITNFSEPMQESDALLALKRDMKPMSELYPHLDEALCDLIDRMTAYAPENRPADYAELLDEIAEVQSGVGAASEELKKRRRKRGLRVLGVAGVLLLGAAAAFGVALMSSPPPLRESVSVPSSFFWKSRDSLRTACELMEDGDTEAALHEFSSLAAQAPEPAVRLAAFLMQALADDAFSITPESLGDFRSRIAAAEQGDAADQRLADACKILPDKLEYHQLTPQDVSGALPSPLRAAVLLLAARDYIIRGNGSAATSCLDAAVSCLPDSPVTQPLSETVQNQRRNLPRVMVQENRKYISTLMKAGNPASALDILRKVDTTHFSPLELAEYGVQQEVCRVTIEAFAMLQRRFPQEFKPDVSPEQVKQLASELGRPQLPDELFSLVCLLHGDYARAFESDPYKNNADAREPFAILMRDWKQRLGL